MRYLITALLVVLFGVPAGAQTSAAKELLWAYERLRDMSVSERATAAELKTVLDTGCRTVRRLAEDEVFRKQLRAAFSAPGSRGASGSTMALRNDVRRFANEFLPWELMQLREAGVSEDVAATMLVALSTVRRMGAADSADSFEILMRELRDGMCKAASEITDKLERDRMRELVLVYSTKILGLFIAVVNAGALVAQPASAPLAGASIAIGGAIMTTVDPPRLF